VLILESGSYDNTKEALKELDAELGRVNASRIIGLVGISHKVEVERVPIPESQDGYGLIEARKSLDACRISQRLGIG